MMRITPRQLLDALYAGCTALAALCLAAIALLVLAQIVGRWFDVLVPAATEIAGYLMGAATFLALAGTQRDAGHVRVTLLIRRLPVRHRRAQEIAVLALALLLVLLMTSAAIGLVIESWTFGDVADGYLAVPLWLPQLPFALGLAAFSVALLDDMADVLAGRAP